MVDGMCARCGNVFSVRKIVNHFKKCDSITINTTKQKKFILKVLGPGGFWLYVGVAESTTLEKLDEFLREIWLECCGHLSNFEINGITYTSKENMDSSFDDKNINVKVKKLFYTGLKFKHTYDYGSTTTLTLTVHSECFDDIATKDPVELLARNLKQSYECGKCKNLATVVHSDYMYEDEYPFRCDECVKDEDEEMFLKVVNSPRMGTCAYEFETPLTGK